MRQPDFDGALGEFSLGEEVLNSHGQGAVRSTSASTYFESSVATSWVLQFDGDEGKLATAFRNLLPQPGHCIYNAITGSRKELLYIVNSTMYGLVVWPVTRVKEVRQRYIRHQCDAVGRWAFLHISELDGRKVIEAETGCAHDFDQQARSATASARCILGFQRRRDSKHEEAHHLLADGSRPHAFKRG